MFDKFKNVLKGFKKSNEVKINKDKESLEDNITDLNTTRRIKTNVNAKHQNCVDLANELREYVKNTNIDDIEEIIELRAKKNKNKKEERKQELKDNILKKVEEVKPDPIVEDEEIVMVEDKEMSIVDNEFELLDFYRENNSDGVVDSKNKIAIRLGLHPEKVRRLNDKLKNLECLETQGNYNLLTEKGFKADIEELKMEGSL